MIALWYSNMAMENLRFIDDFLYFPIQMPVEFKFGDFPASHGADDSGGYPTHRPRYMTKLSIKREVGLFHRQAFGANRKSWYVQFHQLQALQHWPPWNDDIWWSLPTNISLGMGCSKSRGLLYSAASTALYPDATWQKARKADVPLFPVGWFNIKVVERYCKTWCFAGFPIKQMWISW